MAATLPKTNNAAAPTMGLFAALQKQGITMKKSTTNADMEPPGSPGKSPKKHSMPAEEGGNRLELILNTAIKKRMGMDYLSERSGLDMRKYTKEYISHRLERFKNKQKKWIMTREDLIEFASQEYHVSMTMLSATDAILFCRGPQLDSPDAPYNEEKLLHWLSASLPGMRNIDHKFQPRQNPNKQDLATSQDHFHLFKMSGVGTINRRAIQSQRQSHSRLPSFDDRNVTTLKQMNDCLKECEKAPTLKKKVQETLNSLEQSMIDYRAQKGMEASMIARRRLRHKVISEEESKEKSVQVMLEQTAVLDSPIRAANLQEVLKKQWCEYKDSYVIMSKLTKRQKQKLNDMIFNRYNDL